MSKVKRPHPTLVMFRDYESCKMYLRGESMKSIIDFTRVTKSTTNQRIKNKIDDLCDWYLCEADDKDRLLKLLDWEMTKRDLKRQWIDEFVSAGGDLNNRNLDYQKFVIVDRVKIPDYRKRIVNLCVDILYGVRLETLELSEHPFIRDAIKFYMTYHLDFKYRSFVDYCKFTIPSQHREHAIKKLISTLDVED